uniref:Ubiquitin-like protease family profile domain-containing protein n=1 Tax=Daucus carota subsp. sativus TaxID=79200 RepID=A0A164VIV6_DAUCS
MLILILQVKMFYDVFGLPNGGHPLVLASPGKYSERIKDWHAQFTLPDQITTQMIVQVMKNQEVNDTFKLNFLVVMSNVLIGTKGASYVDKQLLQLDDNLDNLKKYNSVDFLLSYLLLYVDSVRHKGINLVDRQFPSYTGSTLERLRERQEIEVIDGVFGVGSIQPSLKEYLQKIDPSEAPKTKDVLDDLRKKAEELVDIKSKFDEDLMKAREKFPDNKNIAIIGKILKEYLIPNQETGDDLGDELSPEIVASLEVVEEMDRTNIEILTDQQKDDERYVPPFSLGLDDIEKENNQDLVTPEPQGREKSKRTKKVGPYQKSPYVNRVIDIKERMNNEDFGYWVFLLKKRSDLLDDLFKWEDVRCIKEHLLTLKPKTSVYYFVIDTWATILNDSEKYKSDESPLKLFCTIGDLHSHFRNYISKNGNPGLGSRVRRMKPCFVSMPWQTTNNSTNYGIFLMRHMETFKGDTKNWNTELTEEGATHDKQITRLRFKYNIAILSSHLNELREPITTEATSLYNTAEKHNIINVVLAGKAAEKFPTKKSGKRVKFAVNLISSFHEVDRSSQEGPSQEGPPPS